MRLFLVALVVSVALPAAADGSATQAAAPSGRPRARVVQCTIRAEGRAAFDGPCEFLPDGRNGSFTLSALGNRGELFPEVSMVSVSVVEQGVAEVRGLTTAGVNSRWGEALRSTRDRACWTGDDFEVCAR